MALIHCSIPALFDPFPEPVALLRSGLLSYENPAWRKVFAHQPEGTVPDPLEEILSQMAPPAAAAVQILGRSWQVTLQETEVGQLIILRPQPETAPPLRTDRVSLRLRQDTAALAMALQQLDPDRYGRDWDRARKYLSVANQGLYRILRLCDHLEFVDRTAFHPRPMDLAGCLDELSGEIGSVCRIGGWDFQYQNPGGSILTMADSDLIRRLVLSLVSNAMKAVDRGGTLGLRLARRGKRAILTVWDGGPGLEPDDLSRLFSSGAGDPELTPEAGLGLGLDAVRRIAALHGGAVMVEGRTGTGLRAAVALPIRPPQAGDRTLETPKRSTGGFSPLLVELSDVLPASLYAPTDLDD